MHTDFIMHKQKGELHTSLKINNIEDTEDANITSQESRAHRLYDTTSGEFVPFG